MPLQKEASLIPNSVRIYARRDVSTGVWNRNEGKPAGWIPFGEILIDVTGDSDIGYHSVSDIAAPKQHDRVERG